MELSDDISLEIEATIIYFDKEEYKFLRDGMKVTSRGQNFIFIEITNSSKQTGNILLHEQGHCYYGHTHLSCHSWGWSNKQEHEANMYMIEQRAEEWLSDYDWLPTSVDIEAFLKHFELEHKHYNDAYNIFKRILTQDDIAL
ncbi:zinc peptidase [Lactococcus lactis]|uniref:IrrE N-terminal-like domain-containing protein n=1 Tax=Lactococcus lactis TaxID=1358 RepID=A0AAW5TV25_9LACT|nr:zinc peptidase [Lactococcus lactis]MCW2281373.1 hypothetical protein [Lactococcus lactis]